MAAQAAQTALVPVTVPLELEELLVVELLELDDELVEVLVLVAEAVELAAVEPLEEDEDELLELAVVEAVVLLEVLVVETPGHTQLPLGESQLSAAAVQTRSSAVHSAEVLQTCVWRSQ